MNGALATAATLTANPPLTVRSAGRVEYSTAKGGSQGRPARAAATRKEPMQTADKHASGVYAFPPQIKHSAGLNQFPARQQQARHTLDAGPRSPRLTEAAQHQSWKQPERRTSSSRQGPVLRRASEPAWRMREVCPCGKRSLGYGSSSRSAIKKVLDILSGVCKIPDVVHWGSLAGLTSLSIGCGSNVNFARVPR
jgi:hypothetical protein